jgi:hypothetical protein
LNLKVQKYQIRFAPENMANADVKAELIDKFLNTRTPVNLTDSGSYEFTVTGDAASKASDRFKVVFTEVNLPIKFISVNAHQENVDVDVEWSVNNQKNINRYEVEKSTDGSLFFPILKVAVSNDSVHYLGKDVHAVEGFNYYRIKSISMNGDVSYSDVAKVFIGSLKPSIGVYPNPIMDGVIKLQFRNEPAGKYGMRLMNRLGQIIAAKQITHSGGNSTQTIKWDYNLAHGMYQLEITKPDGSLKVIMVMY